MIAAYFILLVSTLGFPILGLIASRKLNLQEIKAWARPLLLFFTIHNVLFSLGFSIRGDYADYFIFSLEFLAFCFVVFSLSKSRNGYVRTVHILGAAVITGVFLTGIPGIYMFMVFTQDMVSDHVFYFTATDKDYETRRYNFGFATLDNTRYTFDTFRTFGYLPIEQQIDRTDFFDNKTPLNIGEKELEISVRQKEGKDEIVFVSTNGERFSKSLK